MNAVLDAFERWKATCETVFSTPLGSPLNEILETSGLSVETELSRIRALFQSNRYILDAQKYTWCTEAASYSSTVDAHLQYQVLKLLTLAPAACAHLDAAEIPPVKVGCLSSRRLSPWAASSEGFAFIGVPTAYGYGLDTFFRCYFALASLGAAEERGTTQWEQVTNYVGGQDVEIAGKQKRKDALLKVMQMVISFASSHLFESDSLDAEEVDNVDLYYPEVLAEATRTMAKTTGLSMDELDPLVRNADTMGAMYLCNLYVLAHELGHILHGDVLPSDERVAHSSSIMDCEEMADLVALGLYLQFVMSLNEHTDLAAIVRPFPQECQFSMGPAGFFAVAAAIWLGHLLFEFPKRPRTEVERRRENEYLVTRQQIQSRRAAIHDQILTATRAASDGIVGESVRKTAGVIAELYAMEFVMLEAKAHLWSSK